jgi:DNA-binding transcriptional ArsR family regulator
MSQIRIRTTGPDEELPPIFDLLSDRRRLRALAHLSRRSGRPVDVDTLVDVVAAAEPTADRESVAISLAHVHLPKLEQAGLIEYDSGCSEVYWLGSPVEIEFDLDPR